MTQGQYTTGATNKFNNARIRNWEKHNIRNETKKMKEENVFMK